MKRRVSLSLDCLATITCEKQGVKPDVIKSIRRYLEWPQLNLPTVFNMRLHSHQQFRSVWLQPMTECLLLPITSQNLCPQLNKTFNTRQASRLSALDSQYDSSGKRLMSSSWAHANGICIPDTVQHVTCLDPWHFEFRHGLAEKEPKRIVQFYPGRLVDLLK